MDIGDESEKAYIDSQSVIRFKEDDKPLPIDVVIQILSEGFIPYHIAESTVIAYCDEHLDSMKRWKVYMKTIVDNRDDAKIRSDAIAAGENVVELFGKKK